MSDKVWVNGTFDVLTAAHFKLLEYAKSLGECLVVGIDSDRRTRERKGYGRPRHTQEQRKFHLESIRFVDVVVIFDSDEELETFIKTTNVDVMVIGKEYDGRDIVGGCYAKSISFFDMIDSPSSTQLINGK